MKIFTYSDNEGKWGISCGVIVARDINHAKRLYMSIADGELFPKEDIEYIEMNCTFKEAKFDKEGIYPIDSYFE